MEKKFGVMVLDSSAGNPESWEASRALGMEEEWLGMPGVLKEEETALTSVRSKDDCERPDVRLLDVRRGARLRFSDPLVERLGYGAGMC
jgi:hypothetical protein